MAVIVCERRGDWAVALRRALSESITTPVRLVETRSVWECRQRISEQPTALVVVELHSRHADELLDWLADELQRRQTPVAVVASRRWDDHEWLVRELGAVYFQTGRRNLKPLAALVERCVQTLARPTDRRDAIDAIWASLPWPAHASSMPLENES